MGSVINAANAAAGDIFSTIATEFGAGVAGGVGVFAEAAELPSAIAPPGSVINQDVTTNTANVISAINVVTLPGFQQHDGETGTTHVQVQPLRERAGFETDNHNLAGERTQDRESAPPARGGPSPPSPPCHSHSGRRAPCLPARHQEQ